MISDAPLQEDGLRKLTLQYDQWIREQVVPLWLKQGFDPSGACLEQFLSNGTPDFDSPKRVRVQARQMFVVAYAHLQGWTCEGLSKTYGMDVFLNQTTNAQFYGYYPHILGSDNKIINSSHDLYDCAFFLLAYAWRYRAYHDLLALEHAEKLILKIESELKGSKGGWLEGDYPHEVRRQNPHMHLFEAFMALYEASGKGKWLAYAGEMLTLFEQVFYDEKAGVLREFFTSDWHLHPEQGHIVEPGHLMEWVWLLHKYQKITGKPLIHYCQKLYAKAIELGVDPSANTMFDAVQTDGTPLQATKRCWPMTEWIKASLTMHNMTNDVRFRNHTQTALASLMKHYQNPRYPDQYIDQLNKQNQPINLNMPASTLYHLIVAHSELMTYSDF